MGEYETNVRKDERTEGKHEKNAWEPSEYGRISG